MVIHGALVPPPGSGPGDPDGTHRAPALVRLLWLVGLAAVWWLLAGVPAAHAETTQGGDQPGRHHHHHLIAVAVTDQGGIVDARESGGRGEPEARPATDLGGADTGAPCAAAAEPLTAATSSTGPVPDPESALDPVESIPAPATAADPVAADLPAGTGDGVAHPVPPAGVRLPDPLSAQEVPVAWSVPVNWVVPVSGSVPDTDNTGAAAGPIAPGVPSLDGFGSVLGAYWPFDGGSDDSQGGPEGCEPVPGPAVADIGSDRCQVVPLPAGPGQVTAEPAGGLILLPVEPRLSDDRGVTPPGPAVHPATAPAELPTPSVVRAVPAGAPAADHHSDQRPGPAAGRPHRAPRPFAPAGPSTDGMGSGGSAGHADGGHAIPPSTGSVSGPLTVRTRPVRSPHAVRDRASDLTESPD